MRVILLCAYVILAVQSLTFAQISEEKLLRDKIIGVKSMMNNDLEKADSLVHGFLVEAEILENDDLCGLAHYHIGTIHLMKGSNQLAKSSLTSAIKLMHTKLSCSYLGRAYNNQGLAQKRLGQTEQAKKSFKNAIDQVDQCPDYRSVSAIANLSSLHMESGYFEEALATCELFEQKCIEYGLDNFISLEKGELFLKLNERDSALHYVNDFLRTQQYRNSSYNYLNRRIIALEKLVYFEEFEAVLNHGRSIEDSLSLHDYPALSSKYFTEKSSALYGLGLTEDAALSIEQSIKFKEKSIQKKFGNNANNVDSAEKLKLVKDELAELKNDLIGYQNGYLIDQKRYLIFSVVLFCVLVIIVRFFLKQRNVNKKLLRRNMNILEQRSKLKEGVSMAKDIQDWMLQTEQDLQRHISESFIMYRPKDVVSGDVYWFEKVGDKLIVASIDCTGHGIPGAFMSVIAYENMNQIVKHKGIVEPQQILVELQSSISKSFDSRIAGKSFSDGMDLSICSIDLVNYELEFAGAFSSIMVLRKGEVFEYKSNIVPIGQTTLVESEFTTQRISLKQGDCLFLYSDGYLDQFGGEKSRKLNKKNFRTVIQKAGRRPMERAKEIVSDSFDEWKGNHDQIDDVMVIGVRV